MVPNYRQRLYANSSADRTKAQNFSLENNKKEFTKYIPQTVGIWKIGSVCLLQSSYTFEAITIANHFPKLELVQVKQLQPTAREY